MPYGLKIAAKPFDVWHWKASRTDPVGYIDDKYWLGMDPDEKEGGRKADPKESGGYVKNISEDGTTPGWLPSSDDAVLQGAILKSGAEPYSEDKSSEFAVGTEIPGIVIEPIVGF